MGDGGVVLQRTDGSSGEAIWRVRLRTGTMSGSGRILGAGVLLGADRVITCAHVILDADTRQWPERVRVEFPLLQGLSRNESRTATVLDGHRLRAFGKDQGDLAVLLLDRAAPVPSPAKFHRVLDYHGAPVRISGFPERHSGGWWVSGSCLGPGGHGDERVVIVPDPGQRITGGFSGAGVVESGTGRLLGIVVQAEKQDREAYMIPAATIAKYLPDIGSSYVTGPQVIPPDYVVSPHTTHTARPHGLQRQVTRWLHGGSHGWDVELLHIPQSDHTARQALAVVLNMADREQSPPLSTESAALSGAPDLSAAGVEPKVGSISLVIDVAGTSLKDPEQPATREALAALRDRLDALSGRGARPAVAVLGADRSTTSPAAGVRILRDLRDSGARLLLELRGGNHEFVREVARELLPDDRPRRWLDRLCARVDELAAAERRARDAYAQLEPRVVQPPRPGDHAPLAQIWVLELDRELREREEELSAAAVPQETAGWPLLERLSVAEQAVETHLLRAERVERTLKDMLGRHRELCGRLNAAQSALVRRGLGEDRAAVGPFTEAQRLLMVDPCPLPDAERAVEKFEREVRRLRRQDEERRGEEGFQ